MRYYKISSEYPSWEVYIFGDTLAICRVAHPNVDVVTSGVLPVLVPSSNEQLVRFSRIVIIYVEFTLRRIQVLVHAQIPKDSR